MRHLADEDFGQTRGGFGETLTGSQQGANSAGKTVHPRHSGARIGARPGQRPADLRQLDEAELVRYVEGLPAQTRLNLIKRICGDME